MNTGRSCSRHNASMASKAISTCATDRSSPSPWGRALPRDGRRRRKSEMIDDSVDEACARLRDVLIETRGLDRREFLHPLAKTPAGAALLAPLAAVAAASPPEPG